MKKDIRAAVAAALFMFAIMLTASYAMRPSRPEDTACLRAVLHMNPPAHWRTLAHSPATESGLCRIAERLDEVRHVH